MLVADTTVKAKAKVNLFDFTLAQLTEYFLSIGEKKFRATQVFRWLHIALVNDFAAMTDVALELRAKLSQIAEIATPEIVSEHIAQDGVIKWILSVGGNNRIETVYIPEPRRATLCISSQVGCALECKFCSTARQGFNRNLSTGEIVGQLWLANTRLTEIFNSSDNSHISGHKKITNVVMMGMGEPLANYSNVVNALKIMLDDNAYNLAKRKLTLSTSGIVPAIDRLKDDCPVALAVSLHASNNLLREQIIPLNQKYPIEELLAACKRYLSVMPKEIITFEYVMLKDVNDRLEHAQELIKLMRGININCKFNLIPFNPFPNSGFVSSTAAQILAFQQILRNAGYIATIRKTRGDAINAACGQLVGKVIDKTKRQAKWQVM